MRSLRERAILLALALALAACDPGGPQEPEPSSVELVLFDYRSVQGVEGLRYAVVWALGDEGFFVSDDGPLPDLRRVPVKLELPPESVLARVSPRELIVLSVAHPDVLAPAYRPRFVIYEDLDASGDFAPSLSELSGPDRVWGIDHSFYGMAALLDAEAAIAALPMDALWFYYVSTGGKFSSFVRVSPGDPLTLMSWSSAIEVDLDDTAYAAQSLECGQSSFTPTSGPVTIELDSAVDPALCGLFTRSCTSTELGARPAPEFDEISGVGLARVARCRERDTLQSLVIQERRASCDGCSMYTCHEETSYRVLVADVGALPDWWPCGDEVPICTGNDLGSLDVICALVEP